MGFGKFFVFYLLSDVFDFVDVKGLVIKIKVIIIVVLLLNVFMRDQIGKLDYFGVIIFDGVKRINYLVMFLVIDGKL